MRVSRYVSPVARTVARDPTLPRLRWSERRRDVTTCSWAVMRKDCGSTGWRARTSMRWPFSRHSTICSGVSCARGRAARRSATLHIARTFPRRWRADVAAGRKNSGVRRCVVALRSWRSRKPRGRAGALQQPVRKHAGARARAVVAPESPRTAHSQFELWRAVGGCAAHADEGKAGCPGSADRYGLPVPGNLPVHRRAYGSIAAGRPGVSREVFPGLAGSPARPALAAGGCRAGCLQQRKQGGADEARVAGTRSRYLVRRVAAHAGKHPGEDAVPREIRRPLEGAPDCRLDRPRRALLPEAPRPAVSPVVGEGLLKHRGCSYHALDPRSGRG